MVISLEKRAGRTIKLWGDSSAWGGSNNRNKKEEKKKKNDGQQYNVQSLQFYHRVAY